MERVRIVDKYTIVPQMRHGRYGFIKALALENWALEAAMLKDRI